MDQSKGASAALYQHLVPVRDILGADAFEYVASAAASLLEELEDDRAKCEEDLREFLCPYVEAGLSPKVVDDLLHLLPKFPKKELKELQELQEPDWSHHLCHVENLTLLYGGGAKPLLRHATFDIQKGRCYGLVGSNGRGKTTLMSKLAAGQLLQLQSKGLSCCYIQYEEVLAGVDPTMPCSEYVLAKAGTEGVPGLEQLPAELPVGKLSGGWRMRLALACGLARDDDLYLLDEPTNHLDSASKDWLQDRLAQSGKTFMIVSHDLRFLESVCTDVIHITNDGKLEYHSVGSRQFQALLPSASSASGELVEAACPSSAITFPNPGMEGLPHVLAALTECSYRYADQQRPTLTDVSLELTRKCRIGVVGKNGAGKSTLLSLLARDVLPCESDSVWHHKDVRIAYVAQQHFYHLSEHLAGTAVEYIQARFATGWDEELRARLVPSQDSRELAAKHGGRPFYWDGTSNSWKGREVAEVLERKMEDGMLHYLVRWKVEAAEENDGIVARNTWEASHRLREMGAEMLCVAFDSRAAYSRMAARPLNAEEVIRHLRSVGFTDSMAQRPIKSLSAGEMSKLVLAAALWIKPHLVLLDEPTNFIDSEATLALEAGLKSFQGGVVVVSHNHGFLQKLCTSFWCLEQGHLRILGRRGEDRSCLIKSKLCEQRAKREEQLARVRKAAETILEVKPENVGEIASRTLVLEIFQRFLDFTLPREAIQLAAEMFMTLADERRPAHGRDWLLAVLEAVLHVGSYTLHEELGLAGMSPVLVALVKGLLRRGAVCGVDDGAHLGVTLACDLHRLQFRAKASCYGGCCYCGTELAPEEVEAHGRKCYMSPFRLGRQLVKARPSSPSEDLNDDTLLFEMFHGTSPENASSIERHGFRPSVGGMLGPGIYCSRDLRKARRYGSVVLRLAVSLGRVITISYRGHPLQTTWQTFEGGCFDAAWVPPQCGVVPSGLEENCVRSPSQIQVLGRVNLANGALF
ncbi:HEF3 [Symbiodinium natans]|uniref:HEF3 protein n=1 Tax=Symbiodinium natans TaxID=878477 RepID=A0A812IA72_9DINO|nr:HEF3 [Symbiodinium natans]